MFKQRNSLPWDKLPYVQDYEFVINSTLYGQSYLCLVLDEGHEFRNPGPKHSSTLALADLAAIRIIMTATPLQTHTKVSSTSLFFRHCT